MVKVWGRVECVEGDGAWALDVRRWGGWRLSFT